MMKQENHEMLEQIETMLYEYGRKVENKIKSNQEDETRLINEEIEVLKELIDEPIIYDEMDKNLMVIVNERMECLLDDISETDEYKNNLVEFVLEKSGGTR